LLDKKEKKKHISSSHIGRLVRINVSMI